MTNRRTARRGTLAALVALALVGTVARFVLLGDRIAHWDEGRYGYDVLRYAATGVFEYRPMAHAPLLYHVDRILFDVVGASDLVARAPVAVVGGLLPLAAWLYRDHLDRAAVLALGAVLAANPLLVYYSRFLRGDVLVAAFAFTAIGFLARTRATRNPRYLYAASVCGALAFASKPNALLYLLAWIVAGLVVLDQHVLRSALASRPIVDADRAQALGRALYERASPEMVAVAVLNPLVVVGAGPFSALVTGVLVGVVSFLAGLALDDADRAVDRNAVWLFGGLLAVAVAGSGLLGQAIGWGGALLAFTLAWLAAAAGTLGVLTEGTAIGARIRRWRAPTLLATVVFLAVTLVMFAPRNPNGLGLWSTVKNPTALPALVEAGLFDPLQAYADAWLGGHHNDYLTFAVPLLRTLVVAAVVVVGAGAFGFLANRYGDRDPLVEFALVWAAVLLLVTPIAAVVDAPWHAIHVVVPLSIPAAVAVGAVATRLPTAVTSRNVAVAGVGALVLCVAFGAMLTTAAGTAYLHPQAQTNPLVQYGQPADDVRDSLTAAQTAIRANEDGPDVVYYGTYFHVDNESNADQLPIGDVYTKEDGEYVRVATNEHWYNRLPLPWYFEAADATVDSAETKGELQAFDDTDPAVVVVRSQHADNVSAILQGNYDSTTFNLTQRNVTTTIFVDRDALGSPTAARTGRAAAEPASTPWAPSWRALVGVAVPLVAVGVGGRDPTGKR